MSKIKEYFEQVKEPRCKGKCLHLLSDILLVGLLTYLSNGEDYEDMVLFAENKVPEASRHRTDDDFCT